LSIRGSNPGDHGNKDDANENDVRAFLGGTGVKCQLVSVSHVFFLPFDAHAS